MYWILPLLLCSLCWGVLSNITVQQINDKDFIRIPINLQNPDGSEKPVIFIFDPTEERLEFRTADFCEQNNIRSFFCRKLFELAYEQERLYKRSKFLESTILPNLPETPSIPNSHLLRNPKAIQAELIHATSKHSIIDAMKQQELSIWKQVTSTIDFGYSFSKNRAAIIHSCLFANQTTRVLDYLLNKIVLSGLDKELDHLIILHYGVPLPANIYNFALSTQLHIHHVSNESSLFEIPSLRLFHRLASEIVTKKQTKTPTQLLYMHTKGVSYTTTYLQIEDWVNMMLHYLVEKHRMCYHLLASEEFDAIGLNYCTHPRMFSGNFYWVTAEYLANALVPLTYEKSNKYDAEYWLFRSTKMRVYIPHISNVFHASQRYPRYCYTSVPNQEKPSFEVFVEQCQEDNLLEYEYLHGNYKDILTSKQGETMKLEQMAMTKISTGRCRALELYTSVP